MYSDNKKTPSRFPEEMPADSKKNYNHGVIEDVVKNEIEPASSTNPVKPADTDKLNTEFAKKQGEFNL
ncbi:MAG: hypothetical protein IJA62_00195 [Ruminococcus sp.]|nr:hypothetical protein [Ruminococcus sp.]